MRLVLLGTGSLKPTALRYGSSVLLELSRIRLLLDCGPSTLAKLARLGVDARDLDAVFLSHFHIDHTSDVPDLITSLSMDRSGRPSPPERPLRLLGGEGLKDFLDAALRRNPYYGYAAEWMDQLNLAEAVELRPGQEYVLKGLRLKVAEVDHPNGVAVRISSPGLSVTYSGDTAPCEQLVELAKGTDVLIHECSFPDEALMGKHTSERGLAEVTSRVMPRLLIATHLYPHWEGREHEIPEAVRRLCEARTVVARDMLEVRL
ncbi:MAG: MBL fold metallo-hydrolase [Candidatus Caldarchaeales archaeon]